MMQDDITNCCLRRYRWCQAPATGLELLNFSSSTVLTVPTWSSRAIQSDVVLMACNVGDWSATDCEATATGTFRNYQSIMILYWHVFIRFNCLEHVRINWTFSTNFFRSLFNPSFLSNPLSSSAALSVSPADFVSFFCRSYCAKPTMWHIRAKNH